MSDKIRRLIHSSEELKFWLRFVDAKVLQQLNEASDVNHEVQ